MKIAIATLMFVSCCMPFAYAEDARQLFDFEAANAAAAWTSSTPGVGVRGAISGRFASTGQRSLELAFPGFVSDKPKKRSIEATPPISDFSSYRWMITDITNPSERDITIHGQVFDSGNEKQTKYFRYRVPAMSTQCIVHALTFGERDFAHHIDTLRFFVEDFDSEPTMLYIDNIRLIADARKPSPDPSPQLQSEIDRELQKVTAGHIRSARQRLASLNLPQGFSDASRREIDRIDGMLNKFTRSSQQERMQTYWGSQYLSPMLDRMIGLQGDAQRCIEMGVSDGSMIVGIASSMKNVMPRHLPVDLRIDKTVHLDAARDERESFQVAVAPVNATLHNVRITASGLQSNAGQTIPAEMVEVCLVAFTQTRQKPGYKVDYVGWWPDPIIAQPKPVDVELGDVQTWWLRVHVPKDQPPGLYEGQVQVNADGMSPSYLKLSLDVHDFAVPSHTPIPTAINYLHNKTKNFIDKPYIGGWERWHKELKLKHADFLSDYYITLDSIYRFPGGKDEPSGLDMEIIEHLRKQNKLGPFCIGYFFSDRPDKLSQFREYYEQVKNAGLSEYVYIYGFDEQGKWSFPIIANAGQWFRENFPGVLSLTTAGVPLDLPGLEGHIPINAAYYRDKAAEARARYGKQVWWYTCVWPPHPYPNTFIEYEPMDTRILMGAMTARQQPDGFLYYSTSMFNDNTGIDTYPYTDWDPVTFPNSHGDGRWLYIDPQGNLISSMVLENYRDGLEDLAYHMILQHQLNLYDQGNDGWLRLIRRGDKMVGYRSGDGRSWQPINEVALPMGRDVYIGLASSAHNESLPGKVVFEDIQIVGKTNDDWENTDIGQVAGPGATTYDEASGRITIVDQGPSAWGKADAIHYAYQRLSGDGFIQVRVSDLANVDPWVKSGVMIRASLEAGAANAFVALTPEHGTIMQNRPGHGRLTGDKVSPEEDPWAAAAQLALDDVAKIVSGRTIYNTDPEVLYEYRRRLARLIESSPIDDTNPWPDGIPVRGVGVYHE